VNVDIDRERRTGTFTIRGPSGSQPTNIAEIEARGAAWWPLAMARQLDDAILFMRTNELDIGIWILKTEGSTAHVLAADAELLAHQEHWFVRETIGLLRRTFARLDVSSRSLLALVERGSCFAGLLAELALSADRSYMQDPADAAQAPCLILSAANFELYPLVAGQSRIGRRFYHKPEPMTAARCRVNQPLFASEAVSLGLVTAALDDIDWDDEIRIILEERASLSPDALTGLEANLRFCGNESMLTRIFGRLSAWQNWIFIRPNAVGERGALKVYGKGDAARFDWQRV